eukprot:14928124-Heterocapsa_arctica.AAC.1
MPLQWLSHLRNAGTLMLDGAVPALNRLLHGPVRVLVGVPRVGVPVVRELHVHRGVYKRCQL